MTVLLGSTLCFSRSETRPPEDDEEEEEEILGSDDDEQEDPKDYVKGKNCAVFSTYSLLAEKHEANTVRDKYYDPPGFVNIISYKLLCTIFYA